VQILIKNS